MDGSGVSEAEITTQSGRNVVVSLPGVPSAETRELIQASAQMEFRPVLAIAAGGPVETPLPEEQLPKPAAEPANASDDNWITPELYREFESTNCMDPATLEASTEVAPADAPLITCEPGTGAKYILGPVEVPGSDIANATFGLSTSSQGASINEWGVNIEFNGEEIGRASCRERVF